MNNKRSTSHLLPGIGQPVLRALKILAPHFKEIREMWTRLMVTHDPDLDAIDLEELGCVILETHSETLNTGNASAYRVELARCGQSLDRRGVPPVQAMLASSLYLESCCAVLFNLNIRDIELPIALARLNSTSQSFVVSGYSKRHTTNWSKLVERERRRFSQDLHDEIGHNLIVLKLYIELMARDYKRGRKEDVIEKLEEAMTLVNHSINSVRRLVLDLGPAALDQLGLLSSFKIYAGQFSARTGIKVEVQGEDILGMSRNHETALFRVFQGALSNIAEHSKAKKVQITVRMSKESVVQMSIEDDGIGFDTTDRPARQMFGLTAMKERIEKLGGHFSLKSRPGSSKDRSGTKIDVDLPMSKPDKGAARKMTG